MDSLLLNMSGLRKLSINELHFSGTSGEQMRKFP